MAGSHVNENALWAIPSCFELHNESEARGKVFVMKISFHSHANKTNFQMKSFALTCFHSELHNNLEMANYSHWPIANRCN